MTDKNIFAMEQYILELEARVAKLEQALRVSADKFSKAFYESGAMKAIARYRDGVLIDVNESFASTLGFARDEMIGKTALELDLWEDLSQRQEMWEQVSKAGFVKDWESKVRTKSGEVCYVITNVNLISIAGEQCVLVSSNNITRRKKAEEELISTQVLLNRVFDSIPQSLIIKSKRDGTIIEVNQAFLDKNRVTRSEVIGRRYLLQSLVANPEEVDRCYEILEKNGFIRNLEVRFDYISGGESRTVLLNAVPIDWMGEDCLLIVSNDITELRRYQSEISRLDNLNLIGQMAAGVAMR